MNSLLGLMWPKVMLLLTLKSEVIMFPLKLKLSNDLLPADGISSFVVNKTFLELQSKTELQHCAKQLK